MNIASMKNADRFTGFADTYDRARPAMPMYPVGIIRRYLGEAPGIVVDLGCGTGLSTAIWKNQCQMAIGIEPSEDMLRVAKTKEGGNLTFLRGYSHDTGLADATADAVVCSQSFHWMEPVATLKEVNRILKSGGIFAAVDCDWPPVSHWMVDKAYSDLFTKIHDMENTRENLKANFVRYSKDQHLNHIHSSGYFRYAREIVFSNTKNCTVKRLIDLAMSQGGLQNIYKHSPDLIREDVDRYIKLVRSTWSDDEVFPVEFCYRMRIGVK
jgi:ubiquinone/menaquinone biosynthesis C-methylase UbiE